MPTSSCCAACPTKCFPSTPSVVQPSLLVAALAPWWGDLRETRWYSPPSSRRVPRTQHRRRRVADTRCWALLHHRAPYSRRMGHHAGTCARVQRPRPPTCWRLAAARVRNRQCQMAPLATMTTPSSSSSRRLTPTMHCRRDRCLRSESETQRPPQRVSSCWRPHHGRRPAAAQPTSGYTALAAVHVRHRRRSPSQSRPRQAGRHDRRRRGPSPRQGPSPRRGPSPSRASSDSAVERLGRASDAAPARRRQQRRAKPSPLPT